MSDLTDSESGIASWWDSTKAFFKRSEVIFYSRLQVLSGFMLAVCGSIDWTQVTVNLKDSRQSLYIASGLIANGVITEVLRRRNSTLATT